MSASIAVLALLMVSQATALPSLWNDIHQGCTLPTMGYKGHLAPLTDAGLTFTVTDSTGTAVSSFTPKSSYTLKVSYSAEVHIWVGTTGGAFATTTDLLGCNGMSAYMGPNTATSFSVTWNAPDTCANVTVSANAAKSSTDNFRQAKLPLSCSSSTTTPGTPPSTTPTTPTPPSTPTMTPPTAAPPPPKTGGAASIAVSAVAIVVALLALLM